MKLYTALLLSRASAYLAVLAGYTAAFHGIWAVSRGFCRQFHRATRVEDREPTVDGVQWR